MIEQNSVGNLLLQAMSPADYGLLKQTLIRVPLTRNLQLHEAGARIERVYFPEDGVVSIVAVSLDGNPCEVGIFGREGMSETATVLGTDLAPFEAYVQVPGASTLQLDVGALNAAFEQSQTLRRHLLRYVQAMMTQVSSSIAAAGQTIEQRMARWILMCHDRVREDQILITHEFLGMMLNVRRAGVSECLEAMRDSVLIDTARKQIRVVDRRGLMRIAGDSYGLAESEYARLIGKPLAKTSQPAAPPQAA